MRPAAAFILGLILGGGIWLLSPVVTGRIEPWDGSSWYFVGTLITSGLLIGLVLSVVGIRAEKRQTSKRGKQ